MTEQQKGIQVIKSKEIKSISAKVITSSGRQSETQSQSRTPTPGSRWLRPIGPPVYDDCDGQIVSKGECIRAPTKRGRYWEIHPQRPRDFLNRRDFLKPKRGDRFPNTS